MRKVIILAIIIFLLSPPSLIYNSPVKEKINVDNGIKEVKFLSKEIESLNNATFKILYPRCSDPAIVEKGSNFSIIIQKCEFSQIFVKISTAYELVVDEIYLNIEKYDIGNNITIIAKVPEDTPEELYNLTIIIYNGSYFFKTEPRAVSIVNEIDGNFTFIHVTDFHIGDPRGMKENIKETIGWKAAKKCIQEVNLIHPDFVVITGDLVFGQLYPFEYSFEYRKLYQILQEFDVPTYLCPGNHDGYVQCGQDGFEFWQKYFGPLYYSFDYGKAHFIMANSYDWPKPSRFAISYLAFNWGGYIGNQQLRWIEDDLKNTSASIKFLLLHHNPLWDTKNDSLLKNGYEGRKEILSLIEKYGINAVLDGHVHYDNISILNNTVYITTTTAASSLGSNDAYWGYRMIKVRNWKLISYNYKEPKYSIPSYRLNISYENDYKAKIKNDLDMNLTAHISFILPLNWDGKYVVRNGKVEMERKNEKNIQVYVVSSINKKTEKDVYAELL